MKEDKKMNRPRRVLIILCVVIGLFSLYGCGSMFPIRTYSIQTVRGNPDAVRSQGISLYEYGKPTGKPYAVLGKAMSYKRGGLGAVRDLDYQSTPPKDMVEGLKAPDMAGACTCWYLCGTYFRLKVLKADGDSISYIVIND